MEPLSRKEIKEIFSETIEPLIVEFKASHNAHEKEIERLTKQSAEHYINFKALEEKLSKQVMFCQTSATTAQEKTGVRMGDTEKDIARIDQKLEELDKDFTELKEGIDDKFIEIKTTKQFNFSQWIVIAGVAAMIIIGLLPYIGGS